MVRFKLEYNPYYVETKLWKDQNGFWMPISNATSLMSIQRKRLQRWIHVDINGLTPCFFDDIREAAGDDDIEIIFCGTKEDYSDIKAAAELYSFVNKYSSINICEDVETLKNSSTQKNNDLIKMIDNAQNSGYQYIFPNKVWDYLHECTVTVSDKGMLIPFSAWEENAKDIFSDGSWKMICLTLPLSTLHDRDTRRKLRAFGNSFEKFRDRIFERDRLLLLCVFPKDEDSNIIRFDSEVKRSLLECGIPDMPYMFLSDEAVIHLEDEQVSGCRDAYLDKVQSEIGLFISRYAEQYRLRIMHDVLLDMLKKDHLIEGSDLFKWVEKQIHMRFSSAHDTQIKQAYEWAVDLLNSIRNLLLINAQNDTEEGIV